ncbi:hypothetical protein BS47DRAFT_1401124 [Hydnum rufescens UP504]|uniref:Uncharacterized protein n=1 Tax=Hydnum rufescens UP504 TaxID=1448309 RepID=A0A9P6DJL7_9AGAM|nr:hypothetical protein BS47DRAFT_1401124 [Hydnum rufescens UP504]
MCQSLQNIVGDGPFLPPSHDASSSAAEGLPHTQNAWFPSDPPLHLWVLDFPCILVHILDLPCVLVDVLDLPYVLAVILFLPHLPAHILNLPRIPAHVLDLPCILTHILPPLMFPDTSMIPIAFSHMPTLSPTF